MELRNKKINFLGDSITQWGGASCMEKGYVNLLKECAELAEARNYGIAGTRYAIQKEIKYAYEDLNSFAERYDKMGDDADIIVVFGGTNDYGTGDAPLGHFSDRTPNTFYGALHYVYTGLIKKYLGKTIVVMTPLHRVNELRNTGDGNKEENLAILKEYVDIIREVAEYYSLPVLDLYANSGLQPDVPEISEAYFVDGLHPNDAGHSVLAYQLERFLKSL